MRPLHRSRGLAAAAVAALALTGLAALPVHATALPTTAAADAANGGLELITPFNEGRWISTRFDGASTVRLAAALPEGDTGDGVVFSWNPDPAAGADSRGWRDVEGDVLRYPDVGFVALDWTADGVPPGSSLSLRVTSLDADGGSITDVVNDVRLTAENASRKSVRLDGLFDFGGVFTQPYADSGRTADLMAVAGETSAADGDVELSWRADDGRWRGRTQAAVQRTRLKTPDGDYVKGGRFFGALDVTGYDAQSPGLVVGAERGTDDADVAPTDPLEIRDLTASTASVNRRARTVRAALTVVSDRYYVAGAEVMRLADNGVGGDLVGYTDGRGEVRVTQPFETTESYYVNTTDDDAYDPSVDVLVEYDAGSGEVTPGAYVDSRLGTNFDPDEYEDGDLALVAYDEQGLPAADQPIRYRLYPQDSTAPSTWERVVTGSSGRARVRFAVPEGPVAYVLEYSTDDQDEPSTSSTFSFGVADAALTLSDELVEMPSGGSVSLGGRLTNAFGGLRGRLLGLAYLRGEEPSWADGADAGIFRGRARGPLTSSRVATEPNGAFRLTLVDPREGGLPSETGSLQVQAFDQGFSQTVPVQVVQGRATARLTMSGSGNGDRADALRVSAPSWAQGLRVRFLRVGPQGGTTQVASRRLDEDGDAQATVRDRNGDRETTYVVELGRTDRTEESRSNEITRR